MKRLVLILLISLVSLAYLFAQTNRSAVSIPPPERIRFEQLTTANGLPENSATRLLQDHLGFIWIGTQNGLVRYDGTTMTTFRYEPNKPYSLKGRQIRALHEDKNGDIWVGCESLFCYERATGRFIEYPKPRHDKGESSIRYLHEDRQGNLWTITPKNNFQNYVLDRLNLKTKQWTSFRHDPANSYSLASDNIYLSDANISRFSFVEAPDGRIWVITRGAAENILHWFDPKTDQFIRVKPKAPLALSTAFRKAGFVLPMGQHLYVSSYENGLFRYTPQTGRLEQFKHDTRNPNSLYADSVSWLFRSRDGRIWVPTRQSVDRFDPRTGMFTHYVHKPNDLSTPSSGLVRGLQEMPNGDIWFVHDHGLNRYQRQTDRFERYEHDPTGKAGNIQGQTIFSFLVDKTGTVWAGSWGYGLNRQSRTPQFPLLTNQPGNPNSLQSANVQTVYEAPSQPGVIWFGTDKGLDRLDKKTGLFTHYRHDSLTNQSLGIGWVTAIAEDKKGRFWVGTAQNGLYQMDRQTGRFARFVPDLRKNPNESRFQYVTRLLPAADGTLWLCAGGTSLDHIDVDQNRYHHYYQKADAYHPDLFTYLIPRLQPQRRVAGIIHPLGQTDQTVPFTLAAPTDLCVVIGGSLRSDVKWDYGWIEDGKGHKVWEMTLENSKTDSFSDQRVEVKTLQLPPGTYRLRYKSDPDFHYGSWPIFPPIHADLWGVQLLQISAAEREQLNQLLARNYERPGLLDPVIFSLREDRQGNIWTGSNNGGVYRINPATGTVTIWNNSLIGPVCVLSLQPSGAGSGWWIGDYLNGLLLLDRNGKQLRRYDQRQGLPGNRVSAIQSDGQGWLWLMVDNKLCRFNPKTEQLLVFGSQHGIPTDAWGATDGSLKTQNGDLYFWKEKGVNVVSLARLTVDTTPPPVVLTDLAINGQPTTLGDDGQLPAHISTEQEINLPHNQNDLTFHFAALSYNRGNESRYAYQLSPIDKDWVQNGTIRQVRYSDLSPGEYTFRVKAANADGVWNEKGVSLTITIRPPWWLAWWAYLLYALALVGSVWGFIAYRSRALRRENRVLEERVARRTQQVQLQNQEIREQKEEIETQRDYLEQTLTELQATQEQLIQKEKLASLGELTAGIAHEIQNPLNFVNNFSEVSTELIEDLKEGPFQKLPDDEKEYAEEILGDLTSNLQKINHHGGRASSIVKGMLEHSRAESGSKRPSDLNALADEYLKIAYHGLRAKEKTSSPGTPERDRFNCELITNFDPSLESVNIAPQEIGRVLLNLYNNAFYAVQQRQLLAEETYKPSVSVQTKQLEAGLNRRAVEIRVSDNGTGIPESVKAKIFQPFFTTKPTGEGTGLGLSLSYDIITKGHGGSLAVESQLGEGTTFTIDLPQT